MKVVNSTKLPLNIIFDWFKEFSGFIEKNFVGYPDYLIEIIIYVPIGILFGFFTRLFGKYVIISVSVVALVIFFSQYWCLITVHQDKFGSAFGTVGFESLESFFSYLNNWIKEHGFLFAVLVLSFILGWKLGG